jgi:hypothetical protein
MIMGDSWALGEWRRDPDTGYHISHGGVRQYLREAGHHTVSVADAGASNWSQLDRLARHHPYQAPGSEYHVAGVDVIIWFVTDPLRDLDRQPRTLAEFHLERERRIRLSMTQMSERSRDRRVLLVGAVASLPAWLPAEFPGLTVVTRDLTRWLIPDTTVDQAYCNRTWRYAACDTALMDHHELQESRREIFQWRAENRPETAEHRWFWPDGQHPNREAHQRLTQELILPLL